MTSFCDQDHVLPALRAGAVGYQLKDIEPDELVKTIYAAYRGQKFLHPTATIWYYLTCPWKMNQT